MKKNYYCWYILGACCLMISGGMGFYRYTSGLFFTPVAEEFGVGMTAMGSLQTIQGLAGLLSVPFVAKAISGKNIGRVIALVAAIHCVAVATLSYSHSVLHWGIVSFITGLCGSFIYMTPTPLLLARWFKKAQGTVIGFAMLFTGLSGAIATSFLNAVIESCGWRTAIGASAAATALLMIPVALFVVRSDPAEMGLLPYGATEVDVCEERDKMKTEVPNGGGREKFFEDVQTRNMFIILMTTLVLMGYGSSYTPFFTSFALEQGFSSSQGARLASFLMIGTALWKLIIGYLNDRIGTRRSTYLSLSVGMIGFLLVIFFKSIRILYFAGLLCGIHQALGALQPPLIAKEIFGMRLFSKYLAYITAISTVVGALGSGIIGVIYDSTSSYIPGFWLGVVVLAFTAVGMVLTLRYKSKTGYNPSPMRKDLTYGS
jgi:MFS family permease